MAKLKFYPGKLKQLDQAVLRSLEQTGEEIKTRVINSAKMPFDTGSLQNEQTFVDDSNLKNGRVSLVTSAPQARRLYFHPEYDFQTINNAKAGAEWYNDFLPKGSRVKEVQQIFSAFLKRNQGGG